MSAYRQELRDITAYQKDVILSEKEMPTSKPFHRHYNARDSRNIPELNIQLCWVGVWVCVLHACVLMKTERLLRVTCDVAWDQPDWKRPFVWSMLKLCYWHATDKKNSSRKSCLKIPLDEIIGAQLACPHPKTTCDKLTIGTCEWELHNAKMRFCFFDFRPITKEHIKHYLCLCVWVQLKSPIHTATHRCLLRSGFGRRGHTLFI